MKYAAARFLSHKCYSVNTTAFYLSQTIMELWNLVLPHCTLTFAQKIQMLPNISRNNHKSLTAFSPFQSIMSELWML